MRAASPHPAVTVTSKVTNVVLPRLPLLLVLPVLPREHPVLEARDGVTLLLINLPTVALAARVPMDNRKGGNGGMPLPSFLCEGSAPTDSLTDCTNHLVNS